LFQKSVNQAAVAEHSLEKQHDGSGGEDEGKDEHGAEKLTAFQLTIEHESDAE